METEVVHVNRRPHPAATSEPAGAEHAVGIEARSVEPSPWPARGIVSFGLLVVIASVASASRSSDVAWVGAALTVVWSVGGAVCVHERAVPLGTYLVATGAALALALVGSSTDSGWLTSAGIALLPAIGFALALALPDGRLVRSRRWVAGLGGTVTVAVVLPAMGPDVDLGPVVGASVVLGLGGLFAYLRRLRSRGARERARLLLQGWGVLVVGGLSVAVVVLEALIGWPSSPGVTCLALSTLVPAAIAASSIPRAAAHAERLLVQTIISGGVALVVGGVYFAIVLGFASRPEGDEKTFLGLGIVAGLVAVLLVNPTRRRLEEVANERVYGERHAPDEAIRTFGGRMSRAVPMDELLLQLAESLKKTMDLASAEIWTGSNGALDLAVSVPARRDVPRINLTEDEIPVVARARVQGKAWLQVWMPSLLDGRGSRLVRAASIAHLGELHGLIVLARDADGTPFDEEEDTALADLARQVGLALHNVKLDSALQASLDELARRNVELEASRKRVVAASDDARRKIERDLHDGAQQHLVALAVKIGLVKQLLDSDPRTAIAMLDELGGEVQTTLAELRELAHGIYPPLLRDRGLAEALRAAANRSPLPTVVECAVEERFDADIEAAVYFCCLEAMQNAGKYAGDDATITVSVTAADDALTFVVADDGVGFDLRGGAADGHGFVNMRDRLGAISGELTIRARPGAGTTIEGRVPR